LLRGVLDALLKAKEIVLDYTAMVEEGYYAGDEHLYVNRHGIRTPFSE
jgi:hypothetical protein